MVYVAVDIGKRRCVTCVMDQDGSILDTSSYPNTFLDASHYARQVVEKYGECKAVIQSTGSMCMKTYEAFESNGVQVKLANPVKTRAITEAKVKTDNHDEPFDSIRLTGSLLERYTERSNLPVFYEPSTVFSSQLYPSPHHTETISKPTY